MMSEWLNRILAADDSNNWGKLVPLVIFFVIWALSAVSKAFQKKKGAETEPRPSEEAEEPSFDDLARKIRERYAEAKDQAEKKATGRGGETAQQPPARPAVKPPAAPRPASVVIPPPRYQAAPKPMFEVTKQPEGPTLKVVKGLEGPAVNVPVGVEKPILQRVEPGIEKVEGITAEVPMVSTETGTIYKENPYLTELMEQYSTRDGFRKAILNYEILGPPISMRD
jgi:hypothetical protein